ncbi:MAG: hypothetical protein FJ035_08895 [Chloroflexi bacterium]|nr:hypothetical protein [Chloroflexota bacterium]
MRDFVRGIAAGSLRGAWVAAFDTRLAPVRGLWRFFLPVFGRVAPRIASALRRSGGTPAAALAGFAVEGTEGSLRAGEEARAAAATRAPAD